MALKTTADVKARCQELLGWKQDIAYFPVRHHSPTCAVKLDAWLRKYQPDHVLIEGPAAYNDKIDVLADPEHVAPFALISQVKLKDEVVGRAYYPMCDYSPELVALRTARELGAKARFIDLVYGERQVELHQAEEALAE